MYVHRFVFFIFHFLEKQTTNIKQNILLRKAKNKQQILFPLFWLLSFASFRRQNILISAENTPVFFFNSTLIKHVCQAQYLPLLVWDGFTLVLARARPGETSFLEILSAQPRQQPRQFCRCRQKKRGRL